MLKEVLFLLIIFLSNIVQAITGFAGTAIAMPFSLLVVGYETATPVLNLVALGICLPLAILHFKDILWREVLWMLLFVGIGFGAGFLLRQLPIQEELFKKIYGALILITAVYLFFFPNEKTKIPLPILTVLLVLGGVIHQLFVSGGPLVVIYAAHRIREKHAFRATLSTIWIVLNLILFGEHMAMGYFDARIWILLGIGVGASAISFLIGHFLAKKLSQEAFLNVAYCLLFFSGFLLLL
ncbi:MAG: sulfite exporter TauE/SafE family protein [Bacilli bacterium]|nr:sulfite exporter TauE/SafE family protein [Bacilli bacterium]